MKKWESEKHKSWSMPAEGSTGHVAADGSLVVSMWLGSEWCSWITMKRWGPCTGMTAPWQAELEVQRTIKRAELTAFLFLLKRVSGPIKVHVDNKGIIDGLRRGEERMLQTNSWRC